MDLSKLSDSDLQQIAKGDLRMVSGAGLRMLAGEQEIAAKAPQTPAENTVLGALKDVAGLYRSGYSDIKDSVYGATKGASDIGSTLLSPISFIANKFGANMLPDEERRRQIASGLKYSGADTESLPFKAGEIGAYIAGTAGIGVGAGQIAGKYGLPVLGRALQSGGLSLGTPAATTALEAVKNAALRTGAGAAVGGLSAGAIDPESAGTGAMIGGALPGVVKGAGWLGQKAGEANRSVAESLMNSALKPVLKAQQTGDAKRAIRTMLSDGVNVSSSGVDKLRMLADQTDDAISKAISNSPATVSQAQVLDRLNDVRNRFSLRVAPSSDLAAIDKVGEEFASHPLLGGGMKAAPAKTLFIDGAGNVVKDVTIPKEPKIRNLLQELKNAGGINKSELADLGVEKVSQSYPGLVRASGGRKIDSVVEWLEQNQWLDASAIKYADDMIPGGSHELARDMLRDALAKNPVIHPMDESAYFAYRDAIKALEDRGIKQIKIPADKPMIPVGDASIPVSLAQDMKRATYRELQKSYGQLGAAEVEAQKALARGLKEEVAKAVPETEALNSRLGDLVAAIKVADRRVQMGANRNPVGLGWLADIKRLPFWLLDRSDVAKSLLARGLNASNSGMQSYGGLLGRKLESPAIRSGLLAIEANP